MSFILSYIPKNRKNVSYEIIFTCSSPSDAGSGDFDNGVILYDFVIGKNTCDKLNGKSD